MKTTDDWEALLDGTTPGPWRWYWDHGTMTLEGADTMPVATDLYVHDSDLLAAAPEAVAEVVRLRREVASFRDKMARSSERHKSMYDRYLRLRHLLDAEYDWEIACALTRILEGDNDE